MHLIRLFLLFALLVGSWTHCIGVRADEPQSAVLVTGASSGIGRKITEVLADRGHFVYAGARKEHDIAELSAMDNVLGVRLDVTVDADIERAVDLIRNQGRGLHGVVNNAGVAVFSPMNETPEDDIHFVFDVNVLGPYRINRAFMPLLIESGGRTTTIGSISAFVAGRQSGTYSMSKLALEAYTEALAAELEGSAVKVSIVEPGGYKSRIREKVAKHAMGLEASGEISLDDQQREQLERVVEGNESLKEPDEVAEAVYHALFADQPKRRYMVTPNAEQARITLRRALTRVAELNHDQPHSLTRAELVEMLDEVLRSLDGS